MTIETQEPLPIVSPPGVSVEANIAQAKEYLSTHSPGDTLMWFHQQVRNKGPWDYKQ